MASSPSRTFALLLAALAATAVAPGAERPWVIPPIDGEVTGELTPLLLPGAPPLTWTLKVRTEKPRQRQVALTVQGPGLRVLGGAVLDPAGEGAWDLEFLEVDLGEWFGWVAPRLVPEAGAMSLTGTLTGRGRGTWREDRPAGRVELTLRDGRFEDPARKLVFEGLSGSVTLDDLVGRRTPPGQTLSWERGRYDTVEFGAGRIDFAWDGQALRVESATVAVLGGELRTGEIVVSTSTPDVAVTAQLRGVDLGQLLVLLPPVLSAAQGRLDGRLAFQRDAKGVQIGIGHLTLRQGETAELRLSPTPGLLSSQLPEAVRQHYPGLVQLETGGIPLRADRLEVTLTPAGDAEGRTAAVRIEGGPADPALKAPVVLQVNVRGPLEELVKFGTHSNLGLGGVR